MKFVLDEPYPSTASDLTPVVLKIKRAKPDVLFLTSNASDAILLTNTLANIKVHVKAIIGSGGGHADPTFLKAVGNNADGIFDIVEWETDLNKPGVKEANAKFNKLYGYNLAGEAVDAYASTYLIKEALEKAGSADPKKLRQALADNKLCSGPGAIFSYECIDFDQDGQNKNAALVVVQIHNDNGVMKRFSVWPKAARHAGYTPTFPMK